MFFLSLRRELILLVFCRHFQDYTIETEHLNSTSVNSSETIWTDVSPLLTETWFGTFDPDTHIVNSGRWAYFPIMKNANKFSTVFNSYKLLRAPWNQNNIPYLTRYTKVNGFDLEDLPSCKDHFTILQVDDFSEFGINIAYLPHGKIHR